MKTFAHKQVIRRFHVIAFLFSLVGLAIIGKAAYIMFVKRDFWRGVSERYVKDSLVIKPNRGNIFSADGQLLATSLPEYKIYMDFVVKDKDSIRQDTLQRYRDSQIVKHLDSIAIGLNRILPGKSVKWYKDRMLAGMKKRSRHWAIYPYRISFIDYKEIRKLPFFNSGRNSSGFHVETYNETKKPFGSLAARTIGDLYPGKDSARSGLQLAFDTLLRGKPGYAHKQKTLNQYLSFVDVPPVDGADIVTTIDVRMQDFCEKTIVDQLREIGGEVGIVILMEVKTGDVKAIVNMTRCSDGEFREVKNQAVSNLMEPGSVFKPMSFMVAFEDGKISMDDKVDGCNGQKMMYGRRMTDHNWRRGGYQMLTIPECLEYSSNIGVSSVIDKYYHNEPEKFVNGIYKIGVAEDLHLDIPGYSPPRIRRPRKDGSNWSKTALAWMSIGYETQVPPISVLNFYNGVANNGRMMRPRFVTAAMRDGKVIQEFPPQVVRERMCSPEALSNIQTCLEWVVSKGLGKRAGSKHFKVSGKTGTAQIWSRAGFMRDYLVSFAGYFPSDQPQYSCIVCIQKHGLPASGGMQCGPVFSKIAEMVMTATTNQNLRDAQDTVHTLMPVVAGGNIGCANMVLDEMSIGSHLENADESIADAAWGKASLHDGRVNLKAEMLTADKVPDVVGMGGRDALFLLEKMGIKVKLTGVGVVVQQGLAPGHTIRSGETITLRLSCKAGASPQELRPTSLDELKAVQQDSLKDENSLE